MAHEARDDFLMLLGSIYLLIAGRAHGLWTLCWPANAALCLSARSEAMMMDRRAFLRYAGLVPLIGARPRLAFGVDETTAEKADYTLRIGTGLVELAPDHIVSTTLYNGQFPGPLLRPVPMHQLRRIGIVVDIDNDPDDPERRRRRCRGRLAVCAGARDAADLVRAEAVRLPVLSHARRGRGRSEPWHLHRPG